MNSGRNDAGGEGVPPRAAFARGAYRRALVVANPEAGSGLGLPAARELAEGLRQSGVPSEVLVTSLRGEAFTRLRSLSDGTDLVVAGGGDGTAREVIDGLVDPEVHVSLLPYGAANVLATELGYPRDVHLALEILSRKKVTNIDVAHANGHLSFLVTGVGIDAMTLRSIQGRRQTPLTKLDYVDAFARTLQRYRPPRLRVALDGVELSREYGFVLVTNALSYAGVLRPDGDAHLDDGLFEVYLFPTGRIRELLAFAFRGLLRRLPGGAVEMRRARRVDVTGDVPVPFQVDGELGGSTPVEIEIAPNQYRLVIP